MLKLEVGKTYINRNGQERKIVEFDSFFTDPYIDHRGCFYHEDGSYYDDRPSGYDLISEVVK